jgi:hypothetical protein
LILFLVSCIVSAQQTPLQKSDYKELTSHVEFSKFVKEVDKNNDMLKSEVIAKSELGLATYKNYEHLIKKGEYYPILRVTK